MYSLTNCANHRVWFLSFLLCGSLKSVYSRDSNEKSSLSFQNDPPDSHLLLANHQPFSLGANIRSEQDEQQTLYDKPENSVLQSLFEINAKDYLMDSDPTIPQSDSKIQSNKENNENSLFNIFQDLDFLPLVNKNVNHHNEFISLHDKPLLDYIESMRDDAWSHFKSIIATYVNSIDPPFSNAPKVKDSYPVKFMMKLLDMGDTVNIVHLLGKKVDPEVSKFLIETLKFSLPEISALQKITGKDISAVMPSINKVINQFAWLSLRHIIDNLVAKVNSTYSDGELNKYISDLEATNPFAAKGLRFVLTLSPQIPSYDSFGEGRSFQRNRNSRMRSRDGQHDHAYDHYEDGYGYHDDNDQGGYGYSDGGYSQKDIGYGDYGSHGSHGYGGSSYQMGIQLDPYLILAGIGTAALLAFVAFKVLTTMEDGGRKRLKKRSIEATDMVSTILNSIEEAEQLYDGDFYSEAEDVVNSINALWAKITSRDSCARCSLFEILGKKIQHHDSLKIILLSAFAQLIGAQKSGQLLDQMASLHLQGRKPICDKINYSCYIRK